MTLVMNPVARALRSQPAFVVTSLFADGEQGVWFDPSDFATLFQDSDGIIPVTGINQPVGKILDKSGNGNHASQSTATARPVLKRDATGRYYLLFDGVDDSLATPAIDFSSNDEAFTCMGLRKNSDATVGVAMEIGTSFDSPGSFGIIAPAVNGNNSIRYRQTGSVLRTTDAANYAAPVTVVVTGYGKIATPLAAIRANGEFKSSNADSQGTGNMGIWSLSIGRRAAATQFFNGRLYSLIVRNKLVSEQELADTERYVNTKTGAY